MAVMISPMLWAHIPFGSAEGFRAFLGDHAAMHQAMAQAVAGAGLPQYPLHPLGDGADDAWMLANDREHRAVAEALGLADPPDLKAFDLKTPDDFADWMDAHARDHRRLNLALGIP